MEVVVGELVTYYEYVETDGSVALVFVNEKSADYYAYLRKKLYTLTERTVSVSDLAQENLDLRRKLAALTQHYTT
jgi:hypothetical protein